MTSTPVKKERKKRLRLVTGEALLSPESVMLKCDIGKTKLMEMVQAGDFPQPLKDKRLGSLVRWPLSWVESWIEELKQAS